VLIQVYYIAKIKFEFAFEKAFLKIFIVQFVLALIGFLSIKLLMQPFSYVIGIFVIAASLWHSYTEIDKRLDFKSIFTTFKKRF
jgi:hypothetical protein